MKSDQSYKPKMKRNILPKVVAGGSIFILELTAATLPIFAQSMPNKDQLAAQITAQATAQTSTINASTSSSPSSSSSAPAATASVTNTGNNTSTATTTNSNSSTSVSNQNTATVNQTTNAVADTGNNDASRNIAIGGNAGVITTGNATVNTTSVTAANTNGTAITSNPAGCTSALDAVNTGNNTTTANNCSTNTTALVNNGNTTIINQATNALANTGGNTAARNISIGGSSGVITTGNASTNTSSLVTANGSVMLVGGASNGHGPGSGASIVLASASDTARYSSLAYANSFFIITNDNRATIAQTCGAPSGSGQLLMSASACTANTGYNNSSRNIATGGSAGIINTGDAVLNVAMVADANHNGVLLSYASTGSGADSQLINSGNNTSSSTSSNSNQTTGVNNSNSATVNQTVNAFANTGHNRADRNIAFGGNAGVITTGNATVNTVLSAGVNSNQLVFGSAPAVQGSSGDPYAAILNTGNGLDFSQTSNSSNLTNVSNSNFLSLTQNATIRTDTGSNKVLGSIGISAGDIVTGNAEAAVGMSASGNSNATVIGSALSAPIDPVPAPTDTNPTPTPAPSFVGSIIADPSPATLMIGGSSNDSSAQNSTYYYYSTGSYPPLLGYASSTGLYPQRHGIAPLPTRKPLLKVNPGDVLAAENGQELPAAQSHIAWILLSILSSLVGLGVYISRHSFMDPNLYS